MKDGYYMLGESKGLLYLGVSAAFALVLVLFERKKLLSGIDKESFAFFGLMAFLFSNIISSSQFNSCRGSISFTLSIHSLLINHAT